MLSDAERLLRFERHVKWLLWVYKQRTPAYCESVAISAVEALASDED